MIAAIAYGIVASVAAYCIGEVFRPNQLTRGDEYTAFGALVVGAVAVGVIVGLAVGGVG